MNRSWSNVVGCFEVAITPLISGLFFTQYDYSVTNEFISKVSVDYGKFNQEKL